MKITAKHIPILIVTGLTILSFVQIVMSNINAPENLFYIYPITLTFSLISLAVIWLSFFLKRGIWVYLFLILMIASFSDKIEFSSFHFSFTIGSLQINLISLSLLVSHVLLNAEYFRNNKSKEEEIVETESKVEYFIKRYALKSKEELAKMNTNDLVPEAKEAVERLLEK